MRKLELDNFRLYEYDDSDEHQNIIRKISSTDPNKFLGDLKNHIDMINKRREENYLSCAYIAYYKGEDEFDDYPVGFIGITFMNGNYEISSGILPELRRQNFAALLLEDFSEKFLEEKIVDELVIKIDPKNVGSKKIAALVGYEETDNQIYKRSR